MTVGEGGGHEPARRRLDFFRRCKKMKYRIRKMSARDCDAVISLWRSTPGIGLDEDCDSRHGIARYLDRNPGLSFVACEGTEVVGAVLSGNDGRRGYLHHLAVAKSHRRRGIGKELVASCLRSLARRRIAKCNIFLFKTNAAGKSFWERNDWRLREDLSVMQKKTGSS
jgi:ribosomal protein S18 acetylase RimI-like enzyme